ncbi:MAG: hypothetical protein KF811_04320 [Dokdonella sp.]|nr:hypothetical protein [Dokdonella sp.]
MTDTTTQLQQALSAVFRSIAGQVDPEALGRAVTANDLAAIYAAFGVSPAGTEWPALDNAICQALADELLPLIQTTAQTEQEALGAVLPSFAPDASLYEETRATIVSDTLSGFVAAVALLLASSASDADKVLRIRQAVGMTSPQAELFALTQQHVANLFNKSTGAAFDKLRTGTSNQTRADFLALALRSLHPTIRAAIRRMLDRAEGRALLPSDTEALFKSLSKSLIDYRSRAVADLANTAAINAALLAVWLAAQASGILERDARKYWHDRGDDRVRVTHHQIELMNAQGVPLDQPFANPLGKALMFPPAEYGCRCRIALVPKRAAA